MLESPQRGHVTGKALADQKTKKDQDYQILQVHFHWGKEVSVVVILLVSPIVIHPFHQLGHRVQFFSRPLIGPQIT